MTAKFYVISYEVEGDTRPSYVSGELNHPEFEWHLFCPNPHQVEIKNEYVLTVIDKEIENLDFDFYGEQAYLVSEKFLCLSRALQVDFRAVPVRIVLANKASFEKSYSYFLPAQYVSLLDEPQSSYSVELNVETGQPITDKIFPPTPVYEKITKFIAKDIVTPQLFSCVEIMQLVCTETFKREAESLGLKGVKFTPIDERYVYDPWAGW